MLSIITTILGLLAPLLEKFIPDADQRLQLQTQLQEALITNQSAVYTAMASVMAADAASDSWMTRNLRPVAGFSGLGMIWLVLLSAPFGESGVFVSALKDIPSDMWNLVMVTIGGYILARGVENSVKNYASK